MQWSRPVPSFRRKKPSGVRSPVEEGPVALVDVGGDQLARFRHRCGRRAASARRMTSAASRAASRLRIVRLGRDQHLAAEMAALLLGRELVLEMDAGGARLDIGLHDLEGS